MQLPTVGSGVGSIPELLPLGVVPIEGRPEGYDEPPRVRRPPGAGVE